MVRAEHFTGVKSGMNTVPNRVVVRAKGPSPEGLPVRLRFEMKEKNSFSYLVFLNSDGEAEVSSEEFLKAFDEERNAFIMGYVDPRIGFTGTINCKIFDAPDLKSALEAFRMFKGKLSFPEGYEAQLRKALKRGYNPQEYRVELAISR
jgi:hypothetical protein